MTPPRATALFALAALVLTSCADPAVAPEAPARRQNPSPEPTAAGNRPAPATTQAGRVTRMPLGTLFNLQQEGEVLIYDVRPAFFYRLGHIPGARNWPESAFDEQLAAREQEIAAATAANMPVALYCTDLACPDARTTATRLAGRGHHVSVLEGGWAAWRAGELPTE